MMSTELQRSFEIILQQLCLLYVNIETEEDEYGWGGYLLELQRIALYCGAESNEFIALLHNAWDACNGSHDRIIDIPKYLEDCRLASILRGVQIEEPQ